MIKRRLLVCAVCAPLMLVLGCPATPPPEAVLAGYWGTVDDAGTTVFARFDANGQLEGLLVATEDGNILVEIENSTTVLDGDQVTITVPTVAGEAVLEGTLSEDGSTIVGELTRSIEAGEDITVTLPEGEVTLERVEECGDSVCSPNEVCVNDECVDCETNEDCAEGETCEAGECIECETNEDCAEGEVCTEHQCVAEAECATNEDCAEGEVCLLGECLMVPECLANNDCAAGEVCTNGQCVPG